ncbi:MAG: Fic family protein [Hyphomicrobiaceae bacterium]|nr:Fic family protein [Hyphomicrobiaceae bacterium]MCC0009313.1 Fic family protein [Hyphomicrobiaceae bacterium]
MTFGKIARAGSYQQQLSGYSAFVPKPLPPDPAIAFDGELQTLLSKADRALGRLDGSVQTLPNPDLFVFMYVRKEAVLSSQIEGTQSSINDILKVEAQVFDPQRPNDVHEVLNYVTAMNHGLDRLQELPLSIRLIREIHERLMHGVRGHHNNPGELRTTQNWIGPGGCTLHDATFVPPPPHEVAKILGQLENFMHGDDQLPMLIKIGLVHAQFETIHPFLDGNGRVGRLLITFLLCQADILQKPVLYLSHYFKKRRIDYYNCLQNVRDDGDWEGWLKFFLRGISEVSNEATDTARKIVSLRENHRGRITDNFGRSAANGHTLLESLFKRPIINVATVAEKLEITFAAANNLVQRFVDQQMLFEITGQQRYRLFSYEPYISLFSQPLHRSSDGP